jgi:uncharacterized protein (TIGR02145 family)
MKRALRISFSITFISVFMSCTEEPVPPVISTTAVTEITTATAVSGGAVTDKGGANVTERGVCWNTTGDPTIDDNLTSDNWDDSVTLSFTSSLSELSPNTLYYVRAYGTNVGGTGYGNTESFTTLGDEPSSVTLDASDIETHSVTLNGTVNPGLLSTTVDFEYGISTDYGNIIPSDQITASGDSSVNITAVLTGLTPGTTYHFRIKAENSLGTVYGEDMTFTTNGNLPDVLSDNVTDLTMTAATLNGSVNPNYLETDVTFEWGTTTDYGNGVVPSQSPVTGNSPVNISADLSGLTKGTTYHFRIKATNELGTTYSDDMTFKTYVVADADNNLYHSVTIGTQKWMQENLRTTSYKDNSSIPLVTGNTEWKNLSAPGYCWYDNNGESYKSTYGALYNWYTVNTGKLCPSGWHVPTNAEWITLANYLGGESVAGDKLKESGSDYWGDLNTGTNETGFTALPGGYRTEEGTYANIGLNAQFWSSSSLLPTSSYSAILYNNASNISRAGAINVSGFSVRCIKD